ncbi:MAG: PASTA domain-containing protein, partial [bacterium]
IGTKVDLVVSLGAEVKKIPMPHLEGMKLEEAVDAAYSAGFSKVKTEYMETRAASSGIVIAQSVLEDVSADPGKEIRLFAARAPAAATGVEVEGTVELKIGGEKPTCSVLIRLFDEEGERTVYEQDHSAGEQLAVPVSGIGKTYIKVYLDGVLAEEKSL